MCLYELNLFVPPVSTRNFIVNTSSGLCIQLKMRHMWEKPPWLQWRKKTKQTLIKHNIRAILSPQDIWIVFYSLCQCMEHCGPLSIPNYEIFTLFVRNWLISSLKVTYNDKYWQLTKYSLKLIFDLQIHCLGITGTVALEIVITDDCIRDKMFLGFYVFKYYIF